MASKKPKKKVAKAPKKPRATKKENRENPGAGHNLDSLRDEGVPYVERFLKLKASQDSDAASYASDFGKLYDEAAGILGINATILKTELNRIHKNQKAAQKEAEMKEADREATKQFRAAMEGTQFEMFAAGDLASPAEVTEEDEAEEEGAE